MGKTFSERYAAKLAHFSAFDHFPSGRVNREYDKQRKKIGDRKRNRLEARRYYRRKVRRKKREAREAREGLRYVLRVAREVWKREKAEEILTAAKLKLSCILRTQGVNHG